VIIEKFVTGWPTPQCGPPAQESSPAHMHSASPPGLKRPKAHPAGFQRSRASARAVTLEPPRRRAALLSNRAACADQPPRPHASMTSAAPAGETHHDFSLSPLIGILKIGYPYI
jgi:hypothetical protein